MIGDNLIKFLKERPKPLLTLLAQIREENHQLAMTRVESGQQAGASYIVKRPMSTSPTKTIKKEASYVV